MDRFVLDDWKWWDVLDRLDLGALVPAEVGWLHYAVAAYVVWWCCSDHLKRSPPTALPAWPCWIYFGPLQVLTHPSSLVPYTMNALSRPSTALHSTH